ASLVLLVAKFRPGHRRSALEVRTGEIGLPVDDYHDPATDGGEGADDRPGAGPDFLLSVETAEVRSGDPELDRQPAHNWRANVHRDRQEQDRLRFDQTGRQQELATRGVL